MTLSEFKAWFEGYTEGITGAPTKAQFDRIKKKVAAIDGTVTTYPIYVDLYHDYWRRAWPNYPNISFATQNGVGVSALNTVGNVSYAPAYQSGQTGFDSHAAFSALGRAEAGEAA